MFAFLNGRIVPENEAVVSVYDRGFLYGDGLFETIRVCRGRAFRLAQHLERLARGAGFLKIHLPYPPPELQRHADVLISRNSTSEGILRLTLSRGIGERGYLPRGTNHPTLVMTLHPAPPFDPGRALEWAVITASPRVPAGDLLAGFKSANKLVNVLARMEADERAAQEALLLNTSGEVVEAASSNLFWIQNGNILTPPLGLGLLPGITRAVTLEICQRLRMPASERAIKPDELRRAAGVFLTQSAFGVVAINSLDGQSIPVSPQIHEVHRAYCELLTTE